MSYKVSVVLTTYKQIELFEKALESLLQQTYQNLEIIVVDDNGDSYYSSKIRNIVDYYEDERVALHVNKTNSGSVVSRNNGIKISTGEYITFLDDDDYYELNKVEIQLNDMIETHSLFSVCNIILYDFNGKQVKRGRNFMKKNEPLIIKHIKYHIAATSTFMFETNFIKSIGGFNKIDFGDDYYLMEEAIFISDKFVHSEFYGVMALVDSRSGLSSWKNKIATEKELFKHKKALGLKLKLKDNLYVRMRHHVVLAHSYLKGRKKVKGLGTLVFSFMLHPFGFMRILLKTDF